MSNGILDQPDMPDFEPQRPVEGFECIASLINDQLDNIETLMRACIDAPLEKNSDPLDAALESHLESVHNALVELRQGFEDDPLALPDLLHYVVGLERRRVAFLNDLELEGLDFVVGNGHGDGGAKDIETICEGLDGCSYEAADLAFGYYQASLQSDAIKFTDYAIAEYANRPSTIRRERMKVVGKHALDIAKITLGVFGGVVIAKRTRLL